MPEVEETGSTFESNALLKAHGLREIGPEDGWFLADDSGIEIDALMEDPELFPPDMLDWNVTTRKITIRC